MSIKYYTHFLLQELLAKNFECESKDIKVLQWSRLH
jgi:hypothetical protein